jgi:hypothetical protein
VADEEDVVVSKHDVVADEQDVVVSKQDVVSLEQRRNSP